MHNQISANNEAIKESVNKVYEKGVTDGKQAERDAFWDEFQDFGNRTDYMNAALGGYNFNFNNFYPKYDIKITDGYRVFYAWNRIDKQKGSLAARLKECNVAIDYSAATRLQQMFAYGNFTELPTVDFSTASNTDNVFYENQYLEKIESIICNENNTFTNCFYNCKSLIDVTFDGTIGQNLDMRYSPLNYDSIKGIVTVLSSNGSGKTVTLSKTAVTNAFGSTADGSEWANLIAPKRAAGWNFSLI
jgi:hypothetical protein